jgi:hypothetical protein
MAETLPPGKTCRDCAHFSRCQMLFSANQGLAQSTVCDWAPSRFVEPARAAPRPAGVLGVFDQMARPGGYVSPLWPPPGDPRAAHVVIPGTRTCAASCPCQRSRGPREVR